MHESHAQHLEVAMGAGHEASQSHLAFKGGSNPSVHQHMSG